MATHPRVEVSGMDGVPEEMVAELKKEIARNVEATKLVKQREIEATNARDKAADSQRRMQEMMDKYEEMKHKLEWTRLTLAETHSRLEKHNNSRSERLRQSVVELREKAEVTAQRLHQRANGSAANQESAEAKPEETADPLSLAPDSMGGLGALGGMADMGGGGLTDAERMLLQLCQEQRKTEDSSVIEAEPKQEPAERLRNASRDYAATVEALQKKLSASSKKSPERTQAQEAETPATEAEVSAEDAVKESSESCEETACAPQPVESVVVEIEPVESAKSVQAELTPTESIPTESIPTETESAEPVPADSLPAKDTAADSVTAESSTQAAAGAAVEESQDEVVQLLAAKLDTVDADAIKMDLNVEMVAQVEAKVASVRETLGEMAMSEQYMRTKRAQLLARTREREAQLAMQLAAEKEKEAAEMRQKVKQMMLMLDARRNQLRATVDVLQKKTGVVDKVNKILDQKERKANYVEKQRDECMAFDKKPKKN